MEKIKHRRVVRVRKGFKFTKNHVNLSLLSFDFTKRICVDHKKRTEFVISILGVTIYQAWERV